MYVGHTSIHELTGAVLHQLSSAHSSAQLSSAQAGDHAALKYISV